MTWKRAIATTAAVFCVLLAMSDRAGARPGPTGATEKFTFTIQYGIIKAGTATIEYRPDRDGLWLIESRAASNSFFDRFFKVRDRVSAWIDPKTMRSIRFEKELREGGYQKDEYVDFDWNKGVARYEDGTEVPVSDEIRDVLSVFYYVRSQRMPIGGRIPVTYHSSKKNWPVHVDVHQVETIKTPAGKFRCIKIEPHLESVGVFNQKGRLSVWITADERRMPVKLESKVVFGAFEAVLTDYEWSRPPRG